MVYYKYISSLQFMLRASAPLRYVSILLFTICFARSSSAQEKKSFSNKYILFTGLVLTSDSLQPIEHVKIRSYKYGLLGYSNPQGRFVIAVKKGDSLLFEQPEKETIWHVIPDTLSQDRYEVVKLMTADTIHLPVIYIVAMPMRGIFDHAFVNTDIPDDAESLARKNLEQEAMKEQMKLRPADAKIAQQVLENQKQQQMYYYKQVPPQNLFSPMAWGQFIDAWKSGKFKKKRENLTSGYSNSK